MIKYAVCGIIILVEVSLTVSITVRTIEEQDWPQENELAEAIKWMEPLFMLIDCLVLAIALYRTRKVLKDYPALSNDERFMALHVVMVILLVFGTFILTWSDLSGKYDIVFTTVYLILNFVSAAAMALIMAQVSGQVSGDIVISNKKNSLTLSGGRGSSADRLSTNELITKR
jgi:hypothetical protein